jgi:hypothetical protein
MYRGRPVRLDACTADVPSALARELFTKGGRDVRGTKDFQELEGRV